MEITASRLDLDRPRYDQSTFLGRLNHFTRVTSPFNALASDQDLQRAKLLVQAYRSNREPSGTSEDDVWRAKQLYDSAFHPDTGNKNHIIGRMCAQVPLNMAITGCMISFYKTTPAVIFWQWFNQSFNAIVNYTNRGGDSSLSNKEIVTSYGLATMSATGTALLLNKAVKRLPPFCARIIPFFAVATANCINIPFMRNKELSEGTTISDSNGNVLGKSVVCGQIGIQQVLISRILMCMPGMVVPPVIISQLEKKQYFKKTPKALIPIQIGLVGLMLIFATPIFCSLYPQTSSLAVGKLEPEMQEKLARLETPVTHVYFNKGL